MGVLTKRQKEQAKKRLPHYDATEEEDSWYHYCVNNGIIISPVAIGQTIGQWHIGISEEANYQKIYRSKEIYDKKNVWSEFYKMCKYYYDKR